jgi:hypothetical protein
LHDADYIKFKNITLAYNLPAKWAQTIKMSTIRLFATCDNVVTWNLDKNFKGYDVELGGVSGTLDGGGTVPLPRSVMFGINLGF